MSELPAPIGVLVIAQLAAISVGELLNMVPALGEELGWRGWFLPVALVSALLATKQFRARSGDGPGGDPLSPGPQAP